ncbi:hypothetical protein KQI91_01390 [Blautia sp. MSJ-19]|nr:hypothetical protein [Blautia sp. MSJ-19]
MNDAYAKLKGGVIRMTDSEKAAYLRGRRDKAREVIQDIYCNHGGSSHPVYDFFQDSEIGYEEIIGWKLEAKRFCEQKIIEKYAKGTALHLLRDGMDASVVQANIKKWYDIDLSASSLKYLIGQIEIENHFAQIADAIERRPGNGKA